MSDVDNIHRLAGFKRERAKANGAGASGEDKRPVVVIQADNLEDVVDKYEAALIASDRGIYQRGGKIVAVETAKAISASGEEINVQRIQERGDFSLLEDLMGCTVTKKWDGRMQDTKVIEPPSKAIKTLKERGGRLRLPVLMGVVSAPTLRADGSILDKPGYDAATGLVFDPAGTAFDKGPDKPSRDDAERALAKLRGFVSSFPFVSDADLSVALSAMVTAIVRRALPTAPVHVMSANTPATGKTILASATCTLATGRPAAVLAQGSNDEETEKRLGAVFLAGDPVILLDNIESPLGGSFLCQAITSESIRVRILGRSEAIEVPTGATILATGNNAVLLADMTRRGLVSRLDAKVERPELRKFDSDPIAVMKANRSSFVIAVLTLLRAYVVAGRPWQVDPLGSFVEWSNLVRSSLIWAGAADPCGTMEEARMNDPQMISMQAVMTQWRKAIGFERTSSGDAIRTATAKTKPMGGFDTEGTFTNPAFREALILVAGDRGIAINPLKLGNWLRKFMDRPQTIPADESGAPSMQCLFRRDGVLDGNTMWRLVEKREEPLF